MPLYGLPKFIVSDDLDPMYCFRLVCPVILCAGQELLELVSKHCLQKRLPALITYNESTARRDRPGQLSLPAGPWREAFVQVRC
jgi:hypothetical protein